MLPKAASWTGSPLGSTPCTNQSSSRILQNPHWVSKRKMYVVCTYIYIYITIHTIFYTIRVNINNYFTSCDPHRDIFTFSYSQIFWHSIWHIFWHIFWHIIWQIFWYSIWHIFCIYSGISSGILSGISSGILSGKSSGILSGISCVILSDILSGILSGISHSLLSGISSGILSDIPSGISSGILSGISHVPLPDLNREYPRPVFPAGPQPRPSTPSVPCRTSTTTIHAQLRSGRGTLGVDGRGWGPAGNTGRGWSWLRSGREHWAWMVVVEVRPRTLWIASRSWAGGRGGQREEEEEEEEDEEEEDQATDIKSNNPHLAGGEKQIIVYIRNKCLSRLYIYNHISSKPCTAYQKYWLFNFNNWLVVSTRLKILKSVGIIIPNNYMESPKIHVPNHKPDRDVASPWCFSFLSWILLWNIPVCSRIWIPSPFHITIIQLNGILSTSARNSWVRTLGLSQAVQLVPFPATGVKKTKKMGRSWFLHWVKLG